MDKYLGTVLDGRYELLEVLGTGGMAVVYKARDNRLNRLVALKILKDEMALDSDFRRRFKTESQAVAMLSSPNIVAVYDVGESDGVEYLVMELIEGITLKQYMNRKGKLNWKESLHFATQITKALSHAHSRGIIHRDIKPHNIMILKDGSVKVADFGIARLQDNKSTTLTQEALGSVHYISPEQAKGAQVDARSDIYSVGVVLYEMLTSRLPFEGDNAVSVAIQHISSIPLSPREINHEIPPGLESITMKAMNPDQSLRYQTADEMLRDFEEFRKNPNMLFAYGAAGAVAAGYGGGVTPPPSNPNPPPFTPPPPSPPPRRTPERAAAELNKRDQENEKHRDRNRKARRVSTYLGVGIVLMVLVGLAIFIANTFGIWVSGVNEVERREVEDFVGLQINQVLDNRIFADQYDFTVIEETTDAVPPGTIVRQNPSAGRNVAVEDDGVISVRLYVAVATGAIEMPNLLNRTFEDARSILTGLGIPLNSIEKREEYSDTVTENFIVSTLPAPGAMIPEGMPVWIFVSTGPSVQIVTVPNLMGNTLSVAVSALQSLDLDYGHVLEFSNAANGTVIGQDIAAGTSVPARTTVVLTISQGPEPTPTPTPVPPTPTPTPDTGNGDGGGGGDDGGGDGGDGGDE